MRAAIFELWDYFFGRCDCEGCIDQEKNKS
jgi:hypothetical protein